MREIHGETWGSGSRLSLMLRSGVTAGNVTKAKTQGHTL